MDAKAAPDTARAVKTISKEVGATKGIVAVSPPTFNDAGDTAIFKAVPSAAPTDEKTKDLVKAVRAERRGIESEAGATFQVTGTTAVNIDIAAKVQAALLPYLAVVIGLAFLLLLLVFRSVLVPVKAALGFLLFGVGGPGLSGPGLPGRPWRRISGRGPDRADHDPDADLPRGHRLRTRHGLRGLPCLAHARGIRPRGRAAQAVTTGFRHSAQVVVAAALIMIAVFAGFIAETDSMIKMIGFGLAVAVLFDAFVVRMAIVPAVLALLGSRAWWLPGRLDRLLPRVDIEGEALTRRPAETADSDGPAADSPPEVRV